MLADKSGQAAAQENDTNDMSGDSSASEMEEIAVKHNYDREGGWGDHVRVKTGSPALTNDGRISISIK